MVACFRQTGDENTTFLQRRLGIGYPRASRLMDQLGEEGIIVPADGSRPRQVLVGDGDGYACQRQGLRYDT